MRRFWHGLAPFALLVLAVTANATTSKTVGRVTLQAAPDARSATLVTIPAGAVIDVSSCSDSWCRVSWHGRTGWAPRRSLKPADKAPKAGRGYRSSDGQWVPSPTYSPDGPPKGATAQCNDGTYSFSHHRNGTCSHHGGVRQWL